MLNIQRQNEYLSGTMITLGDSFSMVGMFISLFHFRSLYLYSPSHIFHRNKLIIMIKSPIMESSYFNLKVILTDGTLLQYTSTLFSILAAFVNNALAIALTLTLISLNFFIGKNWADPGAPIIMGMTIILIFLNFLSLLARWIIYIYQIWTPERWKDE